ncbi:sulfate transporter CysZ [Halorhodospira neutriphila]|uniref:Sulfate transporter CysZ n=1 Tax=Halorhodospira neutriphila TaxID=168379 RepID=A0ABS1E2H3_9GAMM|nr:sulfate transporter CysZ [Halorhodospira neutriphila]MBK1725913.1 sulfate transporter CysZ [Halorhodospira neutriphila]
MRETPPSNPFAGAGHFIRGFRLMVQPGIRRYVLAPLGINLALFAGAIAAGAAAFAELVGWLQGMIPAWLDWLAWLLWPLFFAGALLVTFYAFSLVANLIAAPFMGPLAAAVERHLTGSGPPPEADGGGVGTLLREAGADVAAELHKMGYFALRAAPLLLLSVIPLLNTLAPLLWLIFGAWTLAQEYLDPPLGNYGLRFREQRPVLARHRWTVLGFGAAATVATTIPGLNFLVLPAAVAGATSLATARMAGELTTATPEAHPAAS